MEKVRRQLISTKSNSRASMMDTLFVVFCLFLFFSMFNVSGNKILLELGSIGMIALTIPAMLATIPLNLLRNKKFTMTFLLVFSFVCLSGVITIIRTKSFDAAMVIAQYIIIFGIYAFSSQMNKRKMLKIAYCVAVMAMILAVFDQIGCMTSGKYYLFTNPNKIGMISFVFACFTVFTVKKKSLKYMGVVVSVVLMLLCNSRTPIMVLCIGVVVYAIFKIFSNKTNNILFVLFLVALICFIFLYVAASDIPFFIELNKIVYDLTGKNLFSGRQRIWDSVLSNYDHSKLLFGYGLGSSLAVFNPEWTYSTHNQILEIFVQQGILGIALLYAMYIAIFSNIHKKYKGNITIKTIFVMVITYNMFEIFLFQNGFNIGIFMWIIIFAGFGKGAYGELAPIKNNKSRRIVNRVARRPQSVVGLDVPSISLATENTEGKYE